MSKFKDITGNGILYITQTYHGENSKTPDTQCAIDISMKAGEFFHSASNGIVELTTSDANGYISIIPTGADFRTLYVHSKDWTVKKGDIVTADQILGKVASYSGGSHIHFGMKWKDNHKPAPQPMDYFDKELNFTVNKTKYPTISNEWFNGGTTLNKELFQDLNYDNTSSANFKVGDRIIFREKVKIRVGSGLKYDTQQITTPNVTIATIIEGSRTADGYSWYNILVDGGGSGWCAYSNGWFEIYTEPIPEPTPTPEAPQAPVACLECEKYQKQITELQNKLNSSELTTETQKKELEEIRPKIDILNGEIEERDKEISGLEDDLNVAIEQKDRFEKQYMEAVEKLNACSKNTLIEILTQFFTDLFQKLRNRTKL